MPIRLYHCNLFWNKFHYVVLTVTTVVKKVVSISQEHSITRYTCENTRLQPNIITDINHWFIVNNNRRTVLLAITSWEDHTYPNMGYIPVFNSGIVSCQKWIECVGYTQTNTAVPNYRGGKQGPGTPQNGGLWYTKHWNDNRGSVRFHQGGLLQWVQNAKTNWVQRRHR